MLRFPPAKINIGLFVTHKRDDGYHDLETIFYPVYSCKDALEIVPAEGKTTQLYITGLPVLGDTTNNLVMKAYELVKRFVGKPLEPIDIYLHKSIPMGAGLGGGSADGTYMLRMLNDYYQLGLSLETLLEMSLSLGSDCPFFLYDQPQFATGRGEQLSPIELNLTEYEIRFIIPNIHVTTKTAFQHILPKPASYDLRKLELLDIENWKHYVVNDFETTIFKVHPELQQKKQQLYDEGALYASMTGTGSVIYGIFKKGDR